MKLSEERVKRRVRPPRWLRRLQGSSEAAVSRRRRLVRLTIAGLLLFFFVIAPTYIALQPGFFQRYTGLSDYYTTWSTSVHAEVSCQSCHTSPTFTAQAAHGARMLGEFYLSVLPLSREPKLHGLPGNDTCDSCHIDLRQVSPSGDLRIPHKAHVEVLKIKCVACHDFLVHEKNLNGNHAPTMEMCMECHNGVKAKADCSACHNEKAIPEDHRADDWTVVHSQKTEDVDCESCHGWTETWCSECHSRRPRSHTKDWRAKHRVSVNERRNCEACHAAPFCVECHGEVPTLNFDPALKPVK